MSSPESKNHEVLYLETLASQSTKTGPKNDAYDSSTDDFTTTMTNPNLLLAGLLLRSDTSSHSYKVRETYGDNPLHRAVVLSQTHTVRSLLDTCKEHYLYNGRNKRGNTPLHYAAQSGHLDILRSILEQERVLVNARNWEGQTPLYLAVLNNNAEAAELLLKHWGDMHASVGGVSIEEAIKSHLPGTYDSLSSLHITSTSLGTDNVRNHLFKAVYSEREDIFIRLMNSVGQNESDSNDGRYTLLQASCLLGLDRCVDSLLRHHLRKSDTFEDEYVNLHVPILWAASWGYYKVLPKFKGLAGRFDIGQDETLLHILAKGLTNKQKDSRPFFSQVNLYRAKQDYDQCILQLLKSSNFPLGINKLDNDNNTPLYYCITNGRCEETIMAMLSHGANLWALDKLDAPLISYLSKETLEKFFDRCVKVTTKPNDPNIYARISYNFMQPTGSDKVSEFELLEYFSKCQKHWSLLHHPVIHILHFFKRKMTLCFFAVNTLLYWFYVLCWTFFALENSSDFSANSWSDRITYYWFAVSLRASLHLLRDPLIFFKRWENTCRILILSCCGIVFLSPGFYDHARSLITLALWLEVAYMAGRYPFTFYSHMFVAVLRSYVRALICFGSVVVGFLMSFYISFCNESGLLSNNTLNWSSFLGQTEAVASLMLGQNGLDDIPFGNEFWISLMIYFVFLFAVGLVFMNFLNALAVSDIQGLADEAELYYRRSFIEVICHFESLFWPRTFTKASTGMSSLSVVQSLENKVKRRLSLFGYMHSWRLMKGNTLVLHGDVMIVDLTSGKVQFEGLGRDMGWQLSLKYVESIRRCLQRQRRDVHIGDKTYDVTSERFEVLRKHVRNMTDRVGMVKDIGGSKRLAELEASVHRLNEGFIGIREQIDTLVALVKQR